MCLTHVEKLKVLLHCTLPEIFLIVCLANTGAAAESWLADLANSNREDLAGWYNGAC